MNPSFICHTVPSWPWHSGCGKHGKLPATQSAPKPSRELLHVSESLNLLATDFTTRSNDAYFAKFELLKAPAPAGLLLQPGDRLAIIGDSITEQKMYSRIIETYLTVCVPELKITARQFGWSGETAEGFRHRMTNDCLRFQPTVATLCYGMNDHGYGPYTEPHGEWYSNNYAAIASSLTASGARVVLGSPGCVGKVPPWAPDTNLPVEILNLNLCRLRNMDIEIAAQEKINFADVFWPMFTGRFCRAPEIRCGLRRVGQRWRASRLGRACDHGLCISQGDGA